MRPRTLPFLALAALILVDVSLAFSPTWLVRTSSGTLENTCQCDCCYPVGLRGRAECVPPIDTSFDIAECSECDVDACAARFPVACAQPSSVVNSDCITRKGWMLRLVPIFFIAISICLLCYGLFFKRFDGYHDDRVQPIPPIIGDVIPQPYNTFSTSRREPVRPFVTTTMDVSSARSSSQLPPISETEELSGHRSPNLGVSTSIPSVTQTQVSQRSLQEQPAVKVKTFNTAQ